MHGRRNREQGWGQLPPPHIFPTKKIQEFKITTYKSVYSNKAEIDS